MVQPIAMALVERDPYATESAIQTIGGEWQPPLSCVSTNLHPTKICERPRVFQRARTVWPHPFTFWRKTKRDGDLELLEREVIRSAVLWFAGRSLDDFHQFPIDTASVTAIAMHTTPRILFMNAIQRAAMTEIRELHSHHF